MTRSQARQSWANNRKSRHSRGNGRAASMSMREHEDTVAMATREQDTKLNGEIHMSLYHDSRDDALRAAIGSGLRQLYRQIEEQPLPDRMMALMIRLQQVADGKA